ncbi:MAG: monovalent cation/H+ antiporter subunit D family protein [gamma proteobacterium symbiont of Bathyaustriella thionipta]|nr:monovalent cation/H+ antiporter subunit D family protein [gamma proteobacterium symbiont of Bathyaustriella thionipta]MCU7948844.1 monovalent cation/H+ antiporter subunit D family protein [gamma proteobacterium symbiont of Bathyaustriella thionipta]MCU7954345.1 monovalent cation/H+ antiporter subunit D family protein [gamma proteobacterium symbiont of Bathyaustriella thionipta]MCU7955302.1 monovalent cation/H+ antiporter subunit D family protein [gamma proteobacterium symbiont of Bathyaustrie
MSLNALLPLLMVLSSLLVGLIIFFLPEERAGIRIALNLAAAVLKLILVGVMSWGVFFYGLEYEFRMPLLHSQELILHADALSILFVTLSTILWLVTTVYAIGYLEDSPHRSRFFGFFSLCVMATVGVAMAGNMITFLLFYELLTLTTYPLIVHRGTEEARRAGRTYLIYTMTGGVLILTGTVWLHAIAGSLDFSYGGFVSDLVDEHRTALIAIFVLLIAGLGVKAALVPFHGWLPQAMIAPAPVSALLHAVAVVKAGAFGIVRVVDDVYGVEVAANLGVTGPLAVLAGVTIIYGSIRALFQDDLKRRLAFSTISQVSYIVLGIAIAGPLATIGGLVHLVHQGVMKITLFFCAGNLAETLGIHKISEMNGVGRRMPWTMTAFTIGAFGMIGVPPLAGFVSKWYLGLGALEVGQEWVIYVLAGSSLLNAAYFLPILYAAWFKLPTDSWPDERAFGSGETAWTLLLPAVITAFLTLAVGLLASMPFSPLHWARFITTLEYLP